MKAEPGLDVERTHPIPSDGGPSAEGAPARLKKSYAISAGRARGGLFWSPASC